MPGRTGHPSPGSDQPGQRVAAGLFADTEVFLDVQAGHDAVLDQHREPLVAVEEPRAGGFEGKAKVPRQRAGRVAEEADACLGPARFPCPMLP